MIRRERVIKDANSEKLLELVEKCKGKGKMPLPVAIVVMGFLTAEYDKTLQQIAEAENMKIVDHTAIAVQMHYADASKVDTEWKRQINEAMMNYQGVIILRHFGDNELTRNNMVNAARTGMKSAKVILVKLMADSVRGFMYHQEKYNELFTSDSQMVIVQNIVYKGISLGERFDYVVELAE